MVELSCNIIRNNNIVITGGTSFLSGMKELAESWFNAQVRIDNSAQNSNNSEQFNMSSVLGVNKLLLDLFKHKRTEKVKYLKKILDLFH